MEETALPGIGVLLENLQKQHIVQHRQEHNRDRHIGSNLIQIHVGQNGDDSHQASNLHGNSGISVLRLFANKPGEPGAVAAYLTLKVGRPVQGSLENLDTYAHMGIPLIYFLCFLLWSFL